MWVVVIGWVGSPTNNIKCYCLLYPSASSLPQLVYNKSIVLALALAVTVKSRVRVLLFFCDGRHHS